MNRPAFIFPLLLAVALAAPAAAEQQQLPPLPAPPGAPMLHGRFGDWAVYSYKENGLPVCFMKSEPKKQARMRGRGDTYIMVTHRPAENSLNVLHITAGFDYLAQSDVRLTIDGKNYIMFTDKDHAWGRDATTDRIIVAAMRDGKSALTVRGRDRKGSSITDSYSLKGATAAWKALNKACKVAAQ